MQHGFLLIDKPTNISSFGVCGAVRRAYNIKKVGHTGTLDPFATGLLIIAIGKATRLIPYLDKAEKTYTTTIQFGATTNTLDTESEPIPDTSAWTMPNAPDIQRVIDEKFMGVIQQTPPQFSSVRQNGVHAYTLARQGEHVDIPPRATEVVTCKLLEVQNHTVKISLRVRAGFYVRAFARDLAACFDTTGYCLSLRRTHINDISVDDAVHIGNLPIPPTQPTDLLDMPQVHMPANRLPDLQHGRAFPLPELPQGIFLLTLDGRTVGVGENVYDKVQPKVVF